MNYAVEFTDVADMEVQDILLWIMGRDPNGAKRWQEGLETAAESLSMFPRRCPLAPENEAFNVEVRQLLYGAYRVLYTLIDSDGDGENDTARILHVRHGARQYLHQQDDDAR